MRTGQEVDRLSLKDMKRVAELHQDRNHTG